jgi:hypothetical protein
VSDERMTSTRRPPGGSSGSGPLALVADTDTCRRRLARADDALVVTLDQRPREWLAAHDHAVRPAFVAAYPHPDCVRTVADPGALDAIAVAVDEFLADVPADDTPAVCVAALDTLCEYAGRRRTERWLAAVAGRVRAAGGTLHCHGCDTDLPHADLLFD